MQSNCLKLPSLIFKAFPFNDLFQKEAYFISIPRFKDLLPKKGVYFVPEGEGAKTREEKEKLENWLMEKGCSRENPLIAIGGGALLDLVGFVAATFHRGIPFFSVPTTLLAMTDAAIGGKVGINVGGAKNALGTFYFPKEIYIDTQFLKSLNQSQFLDGVSEVIKHSLIASPQLFSVLQAEWENLLARDEATIVTMLKESIQIKQEIVSEDLFEKGKRRLLNFGHTLGHAIESGSQFTISHGEAVRRGMLGESYIAHEMGFLPKKRFLEIETLLKRYGQKVTFDLEKVKRALIFDKKNLNRKNRFVMLQDIGEPLTFQGEYVGATSETLIEKALHYTLRGS